MDRKLKTSKNTYLIISCLFLQNNKFRGFKQLNGIQILKNFYCKGFKLNNYDVFSFAWPYYLEGILRTQLKITFILMTKSA